MPERRLTRSGEFVRVVPGHYLESCWAEDLPSRCAAVLQAAPQAVLSHWTALAVQHLPRPLAGGELIHVTVPPGSSRPRWPGVIVHRAHLRGHVTARGLRLCGADRAWCDCAASVAGAVDGPTGHPRRRTAADVADLVAVGDAMLARRPSLAHEVAAVLSTRPGHRGVATAREALAALDARSESAMESRLRWLLHRSGLPAPDVQHEVRDARGVFLARVDLAYPAARVAVEYDGDHHRSPVQWRSDLARRERLERAGWRVVVVTAADLLGTPDAVVSRVRAALHQARAA